MSPIERVLVACVDDERTLAHGASLVDGASHGALGKLARERERFCGELERAGRTLHHTPRARRSWAGALRGAFFDVRRLATGPNRGDVIFACRRSQSRLEEVFAHALEGSWPREIHDVLAEQHRAIQGARDVLVGLQYDA